MARKTVNTFLKDIIREDRQFGYPETRIIIVFYYFLFLFSIPLKLCFWNSIVSPKVQSKKFEYTCRGLALIHCIVQYGKTNFFACIKQIVRFCARLHFFTNIAYVSHNTDIRCLLLLLFRVERVSD